MLDKPKDRGSMTAIFNFRDLPYIYEINNTISTATWRSLYQRKFFEMQSGFIYFGWNLLLKFSR